MFSHLPKPQQDPILSLSIEYRQDPRPGKVDLGIGVYRNDEGETPIMSAIASAQRDNAQSQTTKSYVGLAGSEPFNQAMLSLVLGESSAISRSAVIQTPGASGALRMLADLIKQAQPNARVWISDPSYVNHQPVMEAAGLDVKFYRYFNTETKLVDHDAMLEDLKQATADDVVLLHGCCHNPSGADMSMETWKSVTELAKTQGFTPFIDVAYQGFGDGLEEDAAGFRYMVDALPETMISASCSKNFGLYRERTGVAIVVGEQLQHAEYAKGKLLTLARATYTMPPDHGAALVDKVLNDPSLKQEWLDELNMMRERLKTLRVKLVDALIAETGGHRFDFIAQHKGMFTLLGLNPSQMTALKTEFGVYAVADGRVNIAALSEKDIPFVAKAIAAIAAKEL
jgi:aspartate aminotransferase